MGGRRARRDPVTDSQHQAIARAVDEAEEVTGLQICVYLGPTEQDSRSHAEELFARAGLHARPAVLVLVAPAERRVEIVTSSEARGRVDDDSCATVVAEMTERFRAGDLAGGIVGGVRRLTELAGPGTAPSGQEELPDVVED